MYDYCILNAVLCIVLYLFCCLFFIVYCSGYTVQFLLLQSQYSNWTIKSFLVWLLSLYSIFSSEPKWVIPDDIWYGVSSIRLEGLHILYIIFLYIKHFISIRWILITLCMFGFVFDFCFLLLFQLIFIKYRFFYHS